MDVSWSETCPRCRYPLPAWNARCPECGLAPPGKERGWRYDGEHDLLRVLKRRSIPIALLALLVALLGLSIQFKVLTFGPLLILLSLVSMASSVLVLGFAAGKAIRQATSESTHYEQDRMTVVILWVLVGCLIVIAINIWLSLKLSQ